MRAFRKREKGQWRRSTQRGGRGQVGGRRDRTRDGARETALQGNHTPKETRTRMARSACAQTRRSETLGSLRTQEMVAKRAKEGEMAARTTGGGRLRQRGRHAGRRGRRHWPRRSLRSHGQPWAAHSSELAASVLSAARARGSGSSASLPRSRLSAIFPQPIHARSAFGKISASSVLVCHLVSCAHTPSSAVLPSPCPRRHRSCSPSLRRCSPAMWSTAREVAAGDVVIAWMVRFPLLRLPQFTT